MKKAIHQVLPTLLLLLLLNFCAKSQVSSAEENDLQSTDSTAVLNISVVDDKGDHLKIDYMKLEGKKNGKAYYFARKSSPFSLIVPNGETYIVTYSDLGGKERFTELPIPGSKQIVLNWTLIYEPPKIYSLDEVFFVTGTATLTPASFKTLNELVEVMAFKKQMNIEISGHTDDVGDNKSNQTLSEDRANAVRNYLLKEGADASRIKAIGYGETQPIASNDTDEGRQKNRRTEVRILRRGPGQ